MSIHKVAELAGVSVATVSRVLNNRPRVAPETLANVRRAMSTLGYAPQKRRPGPKPVTESSVQSLNIAFLVLGSSADRATPSFQELLYGVSMAASKEHLSLAYSHVPDPTSMPNVLDQRIDGVLLHGTMPGPKVRQRLESLPTVWLMGDCKRPLWGDQVMSDAYAAGEMAAAHMLAKKHRNVAYFNLDRDNWTLRVRSQAFTSDMRNAGATVHELENHDAIDPADWDRSARIAADRLVDRFLALSPRPTAIFVAEDRQISVLQPLLQSRGVDIRPGGVEMLSCNNERPYLVGLSPVPTEIAVRPDMIGRRGVSQLLWRIRRPDVIEQVMIAVTPELVASR